MSMMANLYSGQGKYDMTEPKYKEYLQAEEEKLGRCHSDTLTSINSLAIL